MLLGVDPELDPVPGVALLGVAGSALVLDVALVAGAAEVAGVAGSDAVAGVLGAAGTFAELAAPVLELTDPDGNVVLFVVAGVLAAPLVPPVVEVFVAGAVLTRVAEVFSSVRALWKYFATSARKVRVEAGAGTLPVRICLNGITRP